MTPPGVHNPALSRLRMRDEYHHKESIITQDASVIAEPGTLSLEFATLSHLTGEARAVFCAMHPLFCAAFVCVRACQLESMSSGPSPWHA